MAGGRAAVVVPELFDSADGPLLMYAAWLWNAAAVLCAGSAWPGYGAIP
jgi:hypothetical protein